MLSKKMCFSFLATLMSICTLMFFKPFYVHANEINSVAAENEVDEENSFSGFEPIQSVGISRQEAIDILGLTAEEAKDVTFYATSINPNQPFDSGYLELTGSSSGSYRTMNGNKLLYAIMWKPLSGDGSQAFQAYLLPYGSSIPISKAYISLATTSTGGPNNEYKVYRSDWLDIINGLDYRFLYNSYIGAGAAVTTPATSSVRVIIGVV